MSNTKSVAFGLIVLLSICFICAAQESLDRPTRPEKFTRPEEVHEYIRKFKEFLDRSANPRYGKRYSSVPIRKMHQQTYPDDLDDLFETYKNYDNLF